MRRCSRIVILCLFALATVAYGARRRAVRHPPPPLVVSVVEPARGPIEGGTTVVIRGIGFPEQGVTVTMDDVALVVDRRSSEELRVVTPPHANGYAALRVSAASGTVLVEFLYVPPRLDEIETGEITTIAGIGQYIGEGNPGTRVPIEPSDIAIDADGNVFIPESARYVVRRIAADGLCTRVAGRGYPTAPGENDAIGDGGAAREAYMNFPRGAAIGPDGALYIADQFNHRIRRVSRETGRITTVAGSGPITYVGAFAGDGGPAAAARLDQPNQVDFDGAGNLFIMDAVNARIRRVTLDGTITTIAGNGVRGFSGDGGPAIAASFDVGPNGDAGAMEVDGAGNVYFTDSQNGRIRRVDAASRIIRTVAGGGSRTDEGAPAAESRVSADGIALGSDGTLFISDATRILRVTADGRVFTLIGTQTYGFSEDGARPPDARIAGVGRMELDAQRGRLLFVEGGSQRVRSVDLATGELSTIAGIGPASFGENGPASAAELHPIIIQLGLTSEDEPLTTGLFRVFRIEQEGTLRTIAGGGLGNDGPPPPERPAIGIRLDTAGIAIAPSGDIYVTGAFEVGRISSDGIYRLIAGGAYGYSGDGGPATSATLDNPGGIAVDRDGNLYIADTWNHVIRRIEAATGIITTFAGKSPPHPPNVLTENGSTGDGGPATNAELNQPSYIAVDMSGNVYVTDNGGVRRIDRAGMIETVVSSAETNCNAGPLASDQQGRVYVRCFNGRILRINGRDATVDIGGVSDRFGFSGDGGPAENAEMRNVFGMAIDSAGNVYLNDVENLRIRGIKGIAR